MSDLIPAIATAAQTPINQSFLAAIGGAFLLALIGLAGRGALRRFADQAPAFLTGLGLLGTFAGIFVALIAFDVSSAASIQRGVPMLLEGMKTAFLTSVLGLGAALFVRLSAIVIPRREVAAEAADLADVVAAIERVGRSLAEGQDRFRNELVAETRSLRGAIVGEADTSLVNQLRALRDESREQAARTLAALDGIAKSLAESATKALIAALEEAIKDFNSKISEQFGQNFARLNEAVGKLLEWQDRYRVQLEELVAHYRAAADAARASAESLARTAEEAKALVAAAERVEQSLGALEALRREIAAGLDGFAETGRRAGEALPQIEASLRTIVERTGKAAELVDATAQRMDDAVVNAGRRIEEATRSLAEQQQSLLETFETQSRELLGRATNQIETAARAQLERINAELQATQRGVNDAINKTFQELDKALQQELTRALEALGGRLAAVTNAFAQDFSQAIDELRRAAQAAQGRAGAAVR